jgi:hypothetical protein
MIANTPRTMVASSGRSWDKLIWDQPYGHLCSTTSPTGGAFGPVTAAARGRLQSVNWFGSPGWRECRSSPGGFVRRQRMGGLGDVRT